MNIKPFLDEPLIQRQPGHSAGSRTLRDMSLNPKSLIFLSVVLMAGVLGAIAAYRIAVPASSSEPAPRESLIVDSAEDAMTRDGRRAGFAPCRKPARLEGGKCVTDVLRTVTLPGQSVAAAPPPAAAPAPAPSSSDDHGHHGGDGEDGHHHGGDDDDDHDGDDDHHGDDDSGHHGGDDDDHDDDDDDDD